MSTLFTTESLISFVILVVLEIVLGIDNVIFVSIIMNRIAAKYRERARSLWMAFGIITRTALLFALSWLVKEIHHKLEGEIEQAAGGKATHMGFWQAMLQIVLIDMVFSFDSIITAGGTAKHIEIMIAAVIVAMVVMFLFSAGIANFIHKRPTLKMLALSFLVMIGFVLLVEGWDPVRSHDMHLKNYVYFAMAFSFSVELLNLRMTKKIKPVELREPLPPKE
jgi:predicted tellurium resistance membrane protein TerC